MQGQNCFGNKFELISQRFQIALLTMGDAHNYVT